MFERATVRMLPLANRAAEHAPLATACCNACRTCATTNIAAAVLGGAVGLAAAFRRLARRLS